MNILAQIELSLDAVRMEIEKQRRYLDDTLYRIQEAKYIDNPDEKLDHIVTPGSKPYWQRLERLTDEIEHAPDVAQALATNSSLIRDQVRAQIAEAEDRIQQKRDKDNRARRKWEMRLKIESFLDTITD